MSEGLTKKQLKELRKLEKMQNRNFEQKNNSFKWIAISVVSALFLVMFIGIIVVSKNKNNPTTEDGKVAIAENAHVRTSSLAGVESTASAENVVTLVEYADLQCPACKTYHPDVKQLLANYEGKLRLLFKHFPLTNIHPNAMDAAIASEAVGKQGKFFEYVDLLYEKQAEWSDLKVVDQKFEEYAKSIGVDIEQYKKDLQDPSIRELIDDQRNEGIANGVTGTPSFFVNNVRIATPPNLNEFKKVIDEALMEVGSSSNEESKKVDTQKTEEEAVPESLPLQQ